MYRMYKHTRSLALAENMLQLGFDLCRLYSLRTSYHSMVLSKVHSRTIGTTAAS